MPFSPYLLPALEAFNHLPTHTQGWWHVPAHGGQPLGQASPYLTAQLLAHDVTELDGLGDLSQPHGVLAQSQQHLADVVGAKAAFYSTQGTSTLLQAALLHLCHPNDVVLVSRQAHKSVVTGCLLAQARPVWLMPSYDDAWGDFTNVSLSTVQAGYAQVPQAKGVVLTSPSYTGAVANVASIAAWCHQQGLWLVIDEAYGAAWPFTPSLCQHSALAVGQGVSFVAHSLHKQGGSLTQTAVGYLPQSSCVEADAFLHTLHTLHTTSPSYLLLASMEASLAWLSSAEGQASLEARQHTAKATWQRFKEALPPSAQAQWHLYPSADASRWCVQRQSWHGVAWADALESTHGIRYEYANSAGAVFAWPLLPQKQQSEALVEGLLAMAALPTEAFTSQPTPKSTGQWSWLDLPPVALPLTEAYRAKGEHLPIGQAIGRVAQRMLVTCPPGIPVIMPGEVITEALAQVLPAETTVWVVANP
jgi:arginine/lysine/ornithine decarboxylase